MTDCFHTCLVNLDPLKRGTKLAIEILPRGEINGVYFIYITAAEIIERIDVYWRFVTNHLVIILLMMHERSYSKKDNPAK